MSVTTDEVMEVVKRLGVKSQLGVVGGEITIGSGDPYEAGGMLFTFRYTREGTRYPGLTLSVGMYVTSLPGGCGGLILHNPNAYPGEQAVLPFFLDVVLEVIREKAIDQGAWGKYIIASTIPDQKPFIAWLQKNKFTVTGRSTNPRTENRMTFWGKDLKPRRVRKVKDAVADPSDIDIFDNDIRF